MKAEDFERISEILGDFMDFGRILEMFTKFQGFLFFQRYFILVFETGEGMQRSPVPTLRTFNFGEECLRLDANAGPSWASDWLPNAPKVRLWKPK